MYISHDEILGAFYKALGWNHVKGALPASTIYIEIHKTVADPAPKQARFLSEQKFLEENNANQYKVKIFFNDTAGQKGV